MGNDFYSLVNFFDRVVDDWSSFEVGEWNLGPAWPNFPVSNVYLDIDKNLTIQIATAGYTEDDLEVDFEGDYLRVSHKGVEPKSDKKYVVHNLKLSKFDTRFYVPSDKYDNSKADASYERGILTITLPQRAESKRKSIKVRKI